VQLDFFAGAQRPGKNDGDQVIALPRQLSALERLVVNELYCLSIRLNFFDLEEAGQFEEHRSLAALAHFKLQRCVRIELRGRFHFCPNLVLRNLDRVGLGCFA
jgi:hypothetical protein